MSLKTAVKSLLLAGATAGAALVGYQMSKNNSSENKENKTTIIQRFEKESYELHAGVLMPKQGESQKDYEVRRTRLEKQENLLRQKLAENIRHQLIDAQKKKLSSSRIEALEDRLEEHETQAHYISYYTPEGQQKLKVYNDNQKAQSGSFVSSASVRRGRTYDF